MSNQRPALKRFGDHKNLGKCGMGPVRIMAGENHFGIAGKFDLPGAKRAIRYGDAAQFHVVLRGHGDFSDGFDSLHAALVLHFIDAEPHRGRSQLAADGLIGSRPDGDGTHVADVNKTAPGIGSYIGAPAGEVDIFETAVTAAGVCKHESVLPVALQVGARYGRIVVPGTVSGFFGTSDAQGSLNGFHSQPGGPGDRDSFKQNGFNGAHTPVVMKAALHDAARKRVVQGDQAHALVVGHIRVNHHAAFACGFVGAGIVDGFVESHGAGKLQFLHSPQILQGRRWVHGEREHGGVRSHYHLVLQAGLQAQSGNAKRMILINLIRIQGAVGAFGNAPGDMLLAAIFNLNRYRLMACFIQQRIGVAAGEQKGHQVFEHGAAPGKQRLPGDGCSAGTGQGKPVLHGNVPLGDRYQAGQAAFAGQQVIMAGKFHRPAYDVANSK